MDNIKHGEKSIILKILFHTEKLDNPKLAWSTGKIYAQTNKARGIRVMPNPTTFNSIEEIIPALMKKLKEHGIELVKSEKGQKILINKDKYLK